MPHGLDEGRFCLPLSAYRSDSDAGQLLFVFTAGVKGEVIGRAEFDPAYTRGSFGPLRHKFLLLTISGNVDRPTDPSPVLQVRVADPCVAVTGTGFGAAESRAPVRGAGCVGVCSGCFSSSAAPRGSLCL